MPDNQSPDLRIRELDKLLKNKFHRPEGCQTSDYAGIWTKQELAETVSQNLDLDRIISTKTIENDLKKMEKYYNAPIDKKDIFLPKFNEKTNELRNVKKIGYFYLDNSEGIFNNNNLTISELSSLRKVIELLKQFKGLQNFEEIEHLLNKLEIKVTKSKNPTIFFDTVDDYTGHHHVTTIANAINKKIPISIAYKAFNEHQTKTYTLHPYQLIEFNNRWFVLAATEEFSDSLGVYGLSRIEREPEYLPTPFKKAISEEIKMYFKDIIGVTHLKEAPLEQIIFKAFKGRAAYIKSKPWHTSQNIIEEQEEHTTFSIHVKQNKELIAHILSFGGDVQVLQPKTLKKEVHKQLTKALRHYD